MKKILFLDIDGVLNRYAYLGAPSTINMIEPELAGRLNKILLFTNADLVISSTWRYLMINGHYSLHGFAHMLKTHGVTAAKVADHTGEDHVNRGRQIRNWLRANLPYPDRFVILDDDDEGMDFHGEKYIRIDSRQGLQDEHVERAIALLGKD
jgi:hypothetical protein